MQTNQVIRILLLVCSVATMQATAFAQNPNDSNDGSDGTTDHKGITFSEPVESIWEFGLKINAQRDTGGVTATVPVPMSWPEQEIEVLAKEKSVNVSRLKESSPTKHTRQLSFYINRINPGQSETVYVRYKVNKRLIIAPTDTSRFVVPQKVPTKLRDFLKPSPYIESRHKRIKEIADSLADDTLGGWEQAKKIYEWVRTNVKYKFDTQIHSCLDALDSEHGDCEELSSLFIAICRAQGIPARAVWVPGHTYPEFYLLDENGDGHWFPCQAAGSYEFGMISETRPILQKGDRFRVAGERKQVRYLRPTLVAKQSDGQVSIEWISRQVDEK